MIKRLLIISCALGAGLITPAASAQVSIATSIRPLQLIADAIVQDRGTVTSIVDARDSPHQTSLLPSQRFALDRSDLLVWIGPQFEVYLADFFAHQSDAKAVITALELPGLILHTIGGNQLDTHIWLNTTNALLIASQIANRLSELDPAYAMGYAENLAAFTNAMEKVNTEISRLFSDPVSKSYAVYHDGYQYFEQQFGLTHAVVLVSDPEIQPGMRQLISARKQIRDLSPQCLIMEQDSNLELIETLVQSRELDRVIIDLLGYQISHRRDGYAKLITRVAEDFASCVY